MQQVKWNVLKYSVFISNVKFNCPGMFRINEHRFNNYIFSAFCVNSDTNFHFSPIIIEFSTKPSCNPTSEPPATLIWVATWDWEPLKQQSFKSDVWLTVHLNLLNPELFF